VPSKHKILHIFKEIKAYHTVVRLRKIRCLRTNEPRKRNSKEMSLLLYQISPLMNTLKYIFTLHMLQSINMEEKGEHLHFHFHTEIVGGSREEAEGR
jgi:hypothetical protein